MFDKNSKGGVVLDTILTVGKIVGCGVVAYEASKISRENTGKLSMKVFGKKANKAAKKIDKQEKKIRKEFKNIMK